MMSLRVCVCTSYSAAAEPRAPRHALAIAALNPNHEVTFVECLPFGAPADGYNPFAGVSNVRRVCHRFASRSARPAHLLVDKTARLSARIQFRLLKRLLPVALNTRFRSFSSTLARIAADVYIGHNVETLVPVCRAAAQRRALAMFDCMEFYSDMGDSQDALDRRIIRTMERSYLPHCALVLASSDEMADALSAEYQISRPLPVYNVPFKEDHVHACDHPGLSLYWRNATVGFGQRGLQDALEALTHLPRDVTLHLQGRLPRDGGKEVKERIAALGLSERVVWHDPYSPPDAVREASRHCVGLCLEHGGVRNHDVTVSNKIFDYLMAGLVVVASDLPGLRGVVERSQGGVLFQPGRVSDLVEKIAKLRSDPTLRSRLSVSGRRFALSVGNREREMERFQEAFMRTVAAARKN